MYATVGVSFPILFINAALFKLPCPLFQLSSVCLGMNIEAYFIPFSRDSAFNLIKAEILGFICLHKKTPDKQRVLRYTTEWMREPVPCSGGDH